MPDALRTAILAVVDAAVNDLVGWTQTHWDADFAAREALVLDWGRSLMATVLGRVVEAGRAPGRPGRCPHCQTDAGPAQLREEPRQLLTQCGPIAITRQRAICRRCHQSWTLPDGLVAATGEGQAFFTLNGVQTQSATCLDLCAEALDMARMGVGMLRVSPHSTGTLAVVQQLAAIRAGQRAPAASGITPAGAEPCNGYWHGRAGIAWEAPA